jgi:DNA ligase-1
MRPGDCLGSLKVHDLATGVEFSIGSGFSQEQRDYFWEHKAELLGRTVKYKYFPTGSKERPRFPTYLGFRDMIDF